jgi:hypothetical protein
VSFEVDHIDEALREGWSVLLTGRLQLVDDEPAEPDGPHPWAGGDRQVLLRLVPSGRSGRRIVAR